MQDECFLNLFGGAELRRREKIAHAKGAAQAKMVMLLLAQ